MEPKKVPEKLESPINYKVLLLILGLVVSFQSFVYLAPETDETEYTIAAVSIVNPLVASIASFWVSKRYWGSKVFGKAYFALGCALAMLFLGEVTWYTYLFVLDIEPYPSLADYFFFGLYPLAATHIILNVRFFKTKIDLSQKIWITAIPILVITIYSYLAMQEIGEANIEFYYSLGYVVGSSSVLALTIVGAMVFRGGVVGVAWLLLLIGILLLTAGDVWFSYLEILEAYVSGHPVELLWYAGYWTITYALYKHKKVI